MWNVDAMRLRPTSLTKKLIGNIVGVWIWDLDFDMTLVQSCEPKT